MFQSLRWGETAESYKYHVDRMTQHGAIELVSLANTLRSTDSTSNILDNGAGSGVVSRRIANNYLQTRITATDINLQMLDTIDIDSPLFKKQVVDAQCLSSQLFTDCYTHVLCSFVLHTVKQPTKCLREMHAVLQKDPIPGVVGLAVWGLKQDHLDIWLAACRTVDPGYSLPRLTDDENCWRTESELHKNLVEAGFRDVRTTSIMMKWPFESAGHYSSFWFGPNPIGK